MESSTMIAAVHKYMEAFEQQDMNIIREIYAADGRVEDPVGTDVHEGIEAICTFYEASLSSGARLELSGTPRCAGNSVAFPFQCKVGDSMRIEIIDVFEFNEEGKVVSMKAYWGPENIQS